VVFVDWEAEIEEFELAVVAVEEVSSCVVFSCASGVLTETLEGGAFLVRLNDAIFGRLLL